MEETQIVPAAGNTDNIAVRQQFGRVGIVSAVTEKDHFFIFDPHQTDCSPACRDQQVGHVPYRFHFAECAKEAQLFRFDVVTVEWIKSPKHGVRTVPIFFFCVKEDDPGGKLFGANDLIHGKIPSVYRVNIHV